MLRRGAAPLRAWPSRAGRTAQPSRPLRTVPLPPEEVCVPPPPSLDAREQLPSSHEEGCLWKRRGGVGELTRAGKPDGRRD